MREERRIRESSTKTQRIQMLVSLFERDGSDEGDG